MRIMTIDDEELAVEYLLGLLRKVVPDAELAGFTEPDEAFAYLEQHQAEIIFLDIDLGRDNGIALARRCKEICPDVNLIFVTGYSEYSMDAFRLHASGYLLKPVREAELREEIDHLRHPIIQARAKRVRVQTFGYFEIFVDGKLLNFPRAKCKECLAYLIDRKGARVTYPDLSSILWEDRPFDRTVQNNTQKVISDLMKTLTDIGMQSLIIKSRREIAIDISVVDCDYYEALWGDRTQCNRFFGEYMSNYSWAEFTLGNLGKMRSEK